MYKCVGWGGLALLILSHFFLKYPMKWNDLVSLRPYYDTFSKCKIHYDIMISKIL